MERSATRLARCGRSGMCPQEPHVLAPVVFPTDAVVEPFAMMIEVADALIARTAMFASFLHMSFAVAAVQIVVFIIAGQLGVGDASSMIQNAIIHRIYP